MAAVKALFAFVTIATFDTVSGTRCLECVDMPHPQDCTKVTTCTPYEICYVEQFVTSGGLILYNSGCLAKDRCAANGKRGLASTSEYLAEQRRSRDIHAVHKRQETVSTTDIATCIECCADSFCNTQGCGETAIDRASRGPICFDCQDQEDPESCRTVKSCYQGQVCMIRKLDIYSNLWTTDCIGDRQCDALVRLEEMQEASHSMAGRRRRETVEVNKCPRCCSDDFCNDSCRQNFTFTTVTTTKTPTRPTTTTTTTTTQKPTTHTITSKTTTHTTTPKPTTHTTTTKPTTRTTTTKPTTRTTTTKPTTHTTTTKPTTSTTTKPTTQTTTTPTPTTTRTTTLAPTTDPEVECESDGYEYFARTRLCLLFYENPQMNWTNAREYCRSKNGILVVKGTGEDKINDVMDIYDSKKITAPLWVGATSIGASVIYIWGDGTRETIDPTEGKDLSKEDCVYMTSGNYHSTDSCGASHGFICERLQSGRTRSV